MYIIYLLSMDSKLTLIIYIYQGETDTEQLGKIFNIFGTPTEADWPGCQNLPNFILFEPRDALNLTPLFAGDINRVTGESLFLDLLQKLLVLNPAKRWSAAQVVLVINICMCTC